MDQRNQDIVNRAGRAICESIEVQRLADRLRQTHYLSDRSMAELQIKGNEEAKWSFLMLKLFNHQSGLMGLTDAVVKLGKMEIADLLNPLTGDMIQNITQPLTQPNSTRITFAYPIKPGFGMQVVLSANGQHGVARIIKETKPSTYIQLTKAQLSVIVGTFDALPNLRENLGDAMAGEFNFFL